MIQTREQIETSHQSALRLKAERDKYESLHPTRLIKIDKAMKCYYFSSVKAPGAEILHPKPILKRTAQLRIEWWDDFDNQTQN